LKRVTALERFAAIVLAAIVLAASTLIGAAAPRASTVDVAIETSAGTIVVRLDVGKAPKTARHFLHAVDARLYDGTSFYRNVTRATMPTAPFEVIQGGLGATAHSAMSPPIALEPTKVTGIHNTDGAIAMARTSDPDSATTEFFLDVGDARYLDAGGPLDPGYAAFGHVVRGMDVVRKIHNAPTQADRLTPEIQIIHMRRVRAHDAAPAR
jgi:peptidyl-prolyl cis-trans isomerase A (cyclophilin A)